MLSYKAIPPSPHLQSVVNSYVVFEGTLPDGFIWGHNLVPALWEFIFFNLSEDPQTFTIPTGVVLLKDVLVTGQYSKPFSAQLSKKVKLIGVQMKVPTLSRLFNVPMHYISDATITLKEFMGNGATDLYDSILEKRTIEESISVIESFLFKKMIFSNVTSAHEKFGHSLYLIHQSKGKKTIKELVNETKMSEKTLQRIFLNQGGLTPKTYSRVYRFNEVIWHFNNHRSLSPDFIYELGYYDQAHFIHEFKSFSRESPLTYFKGHPGVNEFFTTR